MKYIYEKEAKNYEDLASGRVLYNQKGATAFPVRLASEIFLRSKAYLEQKNVEEAISIYDPCCGGGYLLTILFFMHGRSISKIYASDIDEEMIELARRNLALIEIEGMNKRITELKDDIENYNKNSHKKALESAMNLKRIQESIKSSTEVECFRANALEKINNQYKKNSDRAIDSKGIEENVDLIITDIPYGNIVKWNRGTADENENLNLFLSNILKIMKKNSILTIVSDKIQKIEHESFNRIKHYTIGKRRVSFLEIK